MIKVVYCDDIAKDFRKGSCYFQQSYIQKYYMI